MFASTWPTDYIVMSIVSQYKVVFTGAMAVTSQLQGEPVLPSLVEWYLSYEVFFRHSLMMRLLV